MLTLSNCYSHELIIGLSFELSRTSIPRSVRYAGSRHLVACITVIDVFLITIFLFNVPAHLSQMHYNSLYPASGPPPPPAATQVSPPRTGEPASH